MALSRGNSRGEAARSNSTAVRYFDFDVLIRSFQPGMASHRKPPTHISEPIIMEFGTPGAAGIHSPMMSICLSISSN